MVSSTVADAYSAAGTGRIRSIPATTEPCVAVLILGHFVISWAGWTG
jgi:hypothetical protein